MISADYPCRHTAEEDEKNQRYNRNHGRSPEGIPEIKVGIMDNGVQILRQLSETHSAKTNRIRHDIRLLLKSIHHNQVKGE